MEASEAIERKLRFGSLLKLLIDFVDRFKLVFDQSSWAVHVRCLGLWVSYVQSSRSIRGVIVDDLLVVVGGVFLMVGNDRYSGVVMRSSEHDGRYLPPPAAAAAGAQLRF